MTNTQNTTSTDNDTRNTHMVEPAGNRRGHRRSTVVAASLMALGGVALAVAVVVNDGDAGEPPQSVESAFPNTPTGAAPLLVDGVAFEQSVGEAVSLVDQPTSALTDGNAFDQAVDQAIAAIDTPRTALLDGNAFDQAVDQAIAAIDTPRSALLDGWTFQQAIDAAVAAIDWDVSDLDDGPDFQQAIDEAVAASQE